MFTNIEWDKFLVIVCPAYEELCYEFYATFEFEKSADLALDSPGVIKYRLRCTPQAHSINEFNMMLSCVSEDTIASSAYINSVCDYTQPFVNNYIEIWRVVHR